MTELFSPIAFNLFTSPRLHTASNAFSISKHTKPTISCTLKGFTDVLSEFNEVVCGAAVVTLSTRSLAKKNSAFTIFHNDIFHNSFTYFGYATCKTNGSVVFNRRSVFVLFSYLFNPGFFPVKWKERVVYGARYEETGKGFNILR